MQRISSPSLQRAFGTGDGGRAGGVPGSPGAIGEDHRREDKKTVDLRHSLSPRHALCNIQANYEFAKG